MAKVQKTQAETEEIQRGHEARHLLEHPMITGALEVIEIEFDQLWKASDPRDIKTREYAYRMLYVARRFATLLRTIIDSGDMSEAQLQVRRDQAEMLEKE